MLSLEKRRCSGVAAALRHVARTLTSVTGKPVSCVSGAGPRGSHPASVVRKGRKGVQNDTAHPSAPNRPVHDANSIDLRTIAIRAIPLQPDPAQGRFSPGQSSAARPSDDVGHDFRAEVIQKKAGQGRMCPCPERSLPASRKHAGQPCFRPRTPCRAATG